MIGNNNIEYRRKFSVNFLVVMLYEHIYWIDHVKTVEYKIAKKIVLLYRVSQFLNEDPFKAAHFLYFHSYLNYSNIVWASKYATKLKRVYLKQKHTVRIVFNKDKITHSKPLLVKSHQYSVIV